MLEALGLDPAAEMVYRTLLEQPSWGVPDLVRHLGVSESEVREALDRLAILHLVNTAPDLGGALRPVSPDRGLRALLTQTEAEFGRRQRQIEATRAAISLLSKQYGTGSDEADVIERLEGLETVRERLAVLADSTERECLSFIPGGAQHSDTMEASQPLDAQALE